LEGDKSFSDAPSNIPAEKCSGKCVARNVAHLQTHKVSEASKSWSGANTSKEISAGHLRVRTLIQFAFVAKENFVFNLPRRLRKVKMDQRKLMDNANTITDMAKTQNTVYEIVSDMSTRQDALEERIQSLEEKIQTVQVGKEEQRTKTSLSLTAD
jgi:hypothetical protein